MSGLRPGQPCPSCGRVLTVRPPRSPKGEHSFDGGKTWHPNYDPPQPVIFRMTDPGPIATVPARTGMPRWLDRLMDWLDLVDAPDDDRRTPPTTPPPPPVRPASPPPSDAQQERIRLILDAKAHWIERAIRAEGRVGRLEVAVEAALPFMAGRCVDHEDTLNHQCSHTHRRALITALARTPTDGIDESFDYLAEDD